MNPGYAASVLAICSVVLLCLGWKRELFGDASPRRIVALLVIWALGLLVPLQVQAGAVLETNAAMAVGAVLAVVSLLKRESPLVALHAAVLALCAALLAYLQRWGGVHVLHPFADMTALAAVVAAWRLRRPEQQFAVLWIGLASGELMERLLAGGALRIGYGLFWDRWWTAFMLARLLTVVLVWVHSRSRRASM